MASGGKKPDTKRNDSNFSRLTLGDIVDMIAAQLPKGVRAGEVTTPAQFRAFMSQEILLPKAAVNSLLDAVTSAFPPGEEPLPIADHRPKDDPLKLNEILALVPKQINQQQVQDVLRAAQKDHPDVRISAPTYHEVVETNLRRAVTSGAIPKEEVVALVQKAEESDKQHLFLFEVPSGDKRLDDVNKIGRNLFGGEWPDRTGFPKFVSSAPSFSWADFRELKTAKGKFNGWILKAYDTGVKNEVQNLEMPGGRKIRIEDPRPQRLVFVAQWRPSRGLLQIHVPFGFGKIGTLAHLQTFTSALKQAMPIDEFPAWNMEPVRRRIRNHRKDKKANYVITQSTMLDAHGNRTRLTSASVSESLTNSDEANNKLDIAAKADEAQPEITARWVMPGEDENDTSDDTVRTPMGSFGTNEIAFSARVTPEIIEYVADQLVELAKAAS